MQHKFKLEISSDAGLSFDRLVNILHKVKYDYFTSNVEWTIHNGHKVEYYSTSPELVITGECCCKEDKEIIEQLAYADSVE